MDTNKTPFLCAMTVLLILAGPAVAQVNDLVKEQKEKNDVVITTTPKKIQPRAVDNPETATGADVTIGSGVTVTLGSDATMSLGGDFTNNGTFTANTGSTVRFIGTAAQTLSGTTTFDNLRMDGTGGVAGGLLLNSAVTVNGTLTLNNGNITLGSNNLTIASSGSVLRLESHVVASSTGAFIHKNVGSSPREFPVGPTTASYNPVMVSNSGTADDFSVRVKTTFDFAPPDPNRVVNRQWTITEAVAGGSNATLTFQWSTPAETSGFIRGNPLVIGRHNGTQWNEQSAMLGTPSSGVFNATASGFTSFSPFAVGNTGALPVQISSFTAMVVSGSRVRLDWRTISEVNNYGFFVERKRNDDSTFVEIPNSFIPGHGTTNEPHGYTFTDQSPGAPSVWYRLRQVDLDGTVHHTEPIQASGIVSSVEGKEVAPIEFSLKQNYPNPFNPSTEIKFSVETFERTSLKVYDILGKEVATLFDDVAEPGQYYKVRFDGANLASGIYLYRLQSGKRSDLKKLLLLR